jgi:type IV pilus assembly protein PilC
MNINFKLHRVTTREKALFTRSLAATIAAGLPIVKALDILARQTKNEYLKGAINDIVRRLEEGEKFSNALSRYPKIFDPVYIASVSAAEASGKFDEVLRDLADQQEKEYKLESSVKGALVYPLFIVCAMIVAGVILLTLVVPKIQSIFTEAQIALPLATRILIGTANFVTRYWYLVIGIISGLIIWLKYYLASESGKLVYSRFVLKTPVLREVFVNVYMVRFAKTLAMLIKAGVPIVQAVQLVGQVLNNAVYERTLANVAHQLERGVSMSTPLAEAEEFPPIVSQMVVVGEQTGKLDEVMLSLSNFFEEESARSVQTITSLLEPILLIIVGVGVGTMVFAIIVPLYQVSSAIK